MKSIQSYEYLCEVKFFVIFVSAQDDMDLIFIKLFLVSVAWASIESASVVTAIANDENLFPLSIIHINDFHAR